MVVSKNSARGAAQNLFCCCYRRTVLRHQRTGKMSNRVDSARNSPTNSNVDDSIETTNNSCGSGDVLSPTGDGSESLVVGSSCALNGNNALDDPKDDHNQKTFSPISRKISESDSEDDEQESDKHRAPTAASNSGGTVSFFAAALATTATLKFAAAVLDEDDLFATVGAVTNAFGSGAASGGGAGGAASMP